MSENSSTDSFYWKGVTLYQDERVLKVGTDAILLANWVPTLIHHPQHILDVGTGSGILSILMARAFQQSSVIAIDPDENAFRLANLNASTSNYKNRILVEQKDLVEYADSIDQKFDLILSNPPFYMNHILPASGFMQSAKHATLSPAVWISALVRLVNEQGSICIVVPTLMAFDWTREANAHELYCCDRLEVFSFPSDKQSKRSLLCFSHNLGKPDHRRMTMYTTEKIYTPEYATWLGT